jgi:TonB family protein
MKRSSLALLLAMAFALIALAQGELKKITKLEALNAVALRIQPEYPPTARQLHIEGMVELEAVVAVNGSVAKVTIVSGNPLLTGPSSDALRRWKFKPFVEDGKPVQILAPVTFAFKL